MKVDYKAITVGTYILTLTEQERLKLIMYLRQAGAHVTRQGETYKGIDLMLRELSVQGLA